MDYPQVALAFMNRDHAEFVALRDKLLSLSTSHAPVPEVDSLLDELLTHTRHHFAEEERLMQETQFPPYRVHKAEHDSVLAEMSAKIESWKQARDAVALHDWLDKEVGAWFVNHVGSMDFVTAGFIAMKQKTG